MNYRQCKLTKEVQTQSGSSLNVNTVYEQVAFIPDSLAKEGKLVKIKGADGSWDEGWVVAHVSETKVDEAHLPDSHAEAKAHRKKTGDNTPKVKPKE